MGSPPREGPDAVVERGGAVAGAAGGAGHGAEDRVAAVVAADRLGDEPAQAEVRVGAVAGLAGGGGTTEEIRGADDQLLNDHAQRAGNDFRHNYEKADEYNGGQSEWIECAIPWRRKPRMQHIVSANVQVHAVPDRAEPPDRENTQREIPNNGGNRVHNARKIDVKARAIRALVVNRSSRLRIARERHTGAART